MIKRSIKIQYMEGVREGLQLTEIADELSISLATAKYLAREIWREVKSDRPELAGEQAR